MAYRFSVMYLNTGMVCPNEWRAVLIQSKGKYDGKFYDAVDLIYKHENNEILVASTHWWFNLDDKHNYDAF